MALVLDMDGLLILKCMKNNGGVMKKRFVNDWILLGKMQKLQYDYILCIKKSFLFVHLLCLMLTFVLAYFHIRLILLGIPILLSWNYFVFFDKSYYAYRKPYKPKTWEYIGTFTQTLFIIIWLIGFSCGF